MTGLYPIIGIDYGTKHIGMAVTDNKGIIAGPLTTFHITKNRDKLTFIQEFKELIQQYKAKRVLVGFPQAFEKKESESAKKIKNFVKLLEQHIDIPIQLHDESFSTKNAQSMLLSIGKSQKSTRREIDSIACTVFLQEFLNQEADKLNKGSQL